MLEKKTAKAAPKGKAEGAPKTKKPVKKTTATKPVTRTAASKPAAPQARKDDMREHVQQRAYELWEREGRPGGRERDHWLQAEREVARARAQGVGVSR